MEGKKKSSKRNSIVFKFIFCLSLGLVFFNFAPARSASLNLAPSSGTFTVGSTFSVSLYLNTDGEVINTIGTTINFPADKLQLVSPSTGSSIISLWTIPPNVDNQNGRIDLQGGVPGGVKVNNGLITNLTFRVKSVGTAVIKFTDRSKVLLNDGQGTDALKQITNGVYTLVLPPPAGPIVSSETHPNQADWYANPSVFLNWAAESNADGYSYIINENPIDIPDDISEGLKNNVAYKRLGDGLHYFHIKAIKGGIWGGTTHFSVKIDTTPPAVFPIDLIPGNRTARRRVIIQFNTTDALSGLDRYELKIIPLKINSPLLSANSQPIFINAVSPYIAPELPLGTYDVIVRAYDKAQNSKEIVQRLSIVTPTFSFIQEDGLRLWPFGLIQWPLVWTLLALSVVVLSLAGYKVRKWHKQVADQNNAKALPEPIKIQLKELQSYRAKYGKIAVFILVAALAFFGSSASAKPIQISPPLVTTVSHNITNDEIFYIGGKTDTASATVQIFLQNLGNGATISEEVPSNKEGDWFYRHDTFLPSGNYRLWVQSKFGQELSPPGPQLGLSVRAVALQFGSSRLSFEILNGLIFVLGLLIITALLAYIIVHAIRARKKSRILLAEVKEVEASVKRGFAILRRDIQAELSLINKMKMSAELSKEEKVKEAQLLKDLEYIEGFVSREIWEIEHTLT